MRIINGRPPRARDPGLGGAALSRAARLRLQWMDYYFAHGENAALTCRHFGISRQSFYRWKRRHDPENLVSLEDRSHRPHRRRQPTWTPQLAQRVLRLRQQYPRWDVLEAHSRATASLAAQFLDTLQQRMPFPIRAIQVDGGSEFAADFEQACRDRRLRLFVLPPRSPKLNGCVERAQRTHTEEFYEVTPCSWLIPQLNQQLRAWERIYNTIRPHQALDYLTPQQFLLRGHNQQKCH